VFVRSFVEIAGPYPEVREALLHDVGSWLPGLADSAGASGEARMADVGFGHSMRVDRTVAVEVGTPIPDDGRTLVPIRWRPESREALFPALDGEIEAAPVGAASTQLSMTARYTPPFGLLGRVADRALLHRVAEATVKDFVDNVAAVVRDRLAHVHGGRAETGSPGGATGGP